MEQVQAHVTFDFGKFLVNAITLKKSTLTPKGPIYEEVGKKEFNRETS